KKFVFLLAAALPLGAGSVELLPVSAEDIGASMGVEMSKFAFQFEKPVYCTARLQVRGLDGHAVYLEDSSAAAMQRHEFFFTIKDRGRLRAALGLEPPQKDKALHYSVFAPGLEFEFESADLFAIEDAAKPFFALYQT